MAEDRVDSIVLIGAEPETNEEASEKLMDPLKQPPDLVAAAMSQMWEIPE